MNTEIEKLFVPYEIALNLKEKGFNELSIAYYEEGYDIFNFGLAKGQLYNNKKLLISAPLYQQVIDWLSDKYQIFIDIETDCTTYPKFAYSVNKFVGNPKDLAEKEWYWEHPKPVNWFLYRTRKEALEEAIKFALTLI